MNDAKKGSPKLFSHLQLIEASCQNANKSSAREEDIQVFLLSLGVRIVTRKIRRFAILAKIESCESSRLAHAHVTCSTQRLRTEPRFLSRG